MGLKNSGAMFQRMIEWAFRELDTTDPYIDDIIVGTIAENDETLFKQHMIDLEAVLKQMEELQFVAALKKCNFCMREVVFVGHILSRGQRSPAPGKITALQNWPQPNTVTKMRGFLGLANHYSSYVPNYAHLAAPLMDMLKVGRADGKKGSQVKLKWTPERERAWIELRKAVTNDLVVFQLHPDSPFLLCTDASDYAIGAVLEQNRDGKPVPVGFLAEN
jgi:hypothetical protein